MTRIRLVSACLGALLIATLAAAPASATSYGVMVWGGGEFYNAGLLGNGTTHASDVPLAGNGLSGVNSISSGFGQILALMNNGTVMAWGSNQTGELGLGSTGPEECGGPEAQCSTRPVLIGGLSGVRAVAGGGYHSLALLNDGTVMDWGDDSHGQLGPEPVSETCPFGSGKVPCSRKPVPVTGLVGVTALAGGYDHSLALLNNGKVMAWGENTVGQLGNGTTTDSNVPVEVQGLSGVVAISAGYAESMALLSNGTVVAWGGNGHGQLGQEEHPATGPQVCGSSKEPCSSTPLIVKGLSEVTAISAGYWNAIALLANGSVVTWGNNERGQLGIGLTEGPETCPFSRESCSSTPTAVPGLTGVTAIAASRDTQVLALRDDGTVMAWGAASGGQLGNGTHTGSEVCPAEGFYCSSRPVPVTGLVDAVAIAAGAESGIAMLPVTSPPEYGRCLRVTATGNYEGGKDENAGCTKEGAARKFEWYPGVANVKFSAAGGVSTLESVIGVKVVCQTETGTGEDSGRKGVKNVVLTFRDCELQETAKCSSEGAPEGEVVTGTLEGALGIEKSSSEGHIKDKIALDLLPANIGAPVAAIQCGSVHITVRGSLLGPVDTNTMNLTMKRKYTAARGKQKPEQFEAGSPDVLEESANGVEFAQAGLTMESVQTNEEKVEINTVD
jgi:alpha-tubulin suppressor-like RCC1 family protein